MEVATPASSDVLEEVATRVANPLYYETRREKAYYPIFRVNNTLYKLDPDALAPSSVYLENLLSTPGPKNTQQLMTDLSPILMLNVNEPEFEVFLALAYGRPPQLNEWPKGSASNPLLLGLLELSCYFLSSPTRNLALSMIQSRSYYFHPAQLIYLCYEYKAAFRRLEFAPLRDLNTDQLEWLGFRAHVALARVKEAIQAHLCILATEEPQFGVEKPQYGNFLCAEGPSHVLECQDRHACETDWHVVWWNGMGRFLLDGRNLLTWTDSIIQFQKMQFGRVHPGCLEKMMNLVDGSEGHKYVYKMVDSVTEVLMAEIVEDVVKEEPMVAIAEDGDV
ncbi:hypothetical protein B0H14DRAFT_2637268 [Mycena olivaceomarginata]|nr:hypothetical protein B0H14DRAFT_2637268 [Mycena olivaceomarginata]